MRSGLQSRKLRFYAIVDNMGLPSEEIRQIPDFPCSESIDKGDPARKLSSALRPARAFWQDSLESGGVCDPACIPHLQCNSAMGQVCRSKKHPLPYCPVSHSRYGRTSLVNDGSYLQSSTIQTTRETASLLRWQATRRHQIAANKVGCCGSALSSGRSDRASPRPSAARGPSQG